MMVRAPKWRGTSLRAVRRRRGMGDGPSGPVLQCANGSLVFDSANCPENAGVPVGANQDPLEQMRYEIAALQAAIFNQSPGGGGSSAPSSPILAWVQANPFLAGGLGIFAVVMIGKAIK